MSEVRALFTDMDAYLNFVVVHYKLRPKMILRLAKKHMKNANAAAATPTP